MLSLSTGGGPIPRINRKLSRKRSAHFLNNVYSLDFAHCKRELLQAMSISSPVFPHLLLHASMKMKNSKKWNEPTSYSSMYSC